MLQTTVFMVLVGSGLQFFFLLLSLISLLWICFGFALDFWVKITVLNKVRDVLEFFNRQIYG